MGNGNQRGNSLVEYALLVMLLIVVALGAKALLFGANEKEDIESAIRSVGMTPVEVYAEDDVAIAYFKDDNWTCDTKIVFDVVKGEDGDIQLWTTGSYPNPRHMADREVAQQVTHEICKALD